MLLRLLFPPYPMLLFVVVEDIVMHTFFSALIIRAREKSCDCVSRTLTNVYVLQRARTPASWEQQQNSPASTVLKGRTDPQRAPRRWARVLIVWRADTAMSKACRSVLSALWVCVGCCCCGCWCCCCGCCCCCCCCYCCWCWCCCCVVVVAAVVAAVVVVGVGVVVVGVVVGVVVDVVGVVGVVGVGVVVVVGVVVAVGVVVVVKVHDRYAYRHSG